METNKPKAKSRKKTSAKKKAPVQATPVETSTTEGGENVEVRSVNEVLQAVAKKMKITKVTATRCVKTKRGDHFVAFSSQWDTVRDDSEHDVIDGTDSGMTLEEATIALTILQFKADTSCIESAYLGGDITEDDKNAEVRNLRSRYGSKLKELANG